ncbi:MAG TPA: radical SAM protein [Polyangiaceae bacterium]
MAVLIQARSLTQPAPSAISRTRLPESVRRIVVVLIQPTQYDDRGFPHRYRRVVVPSNSIGVMNALTKRALTSLGVEVPVETYLFEDRIEQHARRMAALYRRFPEAGTRLIVGFVGVQTGQFPRAWDLAERWQRAGATCVIGGFHVSGSISTMYDGVVDPRRPGIPCPRRMPAEIQEIMDRGVVVFHGESETAWAGVLADILQERQEPLYRGGQPDLTDAPMPEFPDGYFDGAFATRVRTIDTCRGCPFTCSFCEIINVQGRKSRPRSPDKILAWVRGICEAEGGAALFFTDDNFARNRRWEELLDGLIRLRQEGYGIRFMIEADLACYKIPRFIDKLAAAGCEQIFMGVESMNAENLAQASKVQNHVDTFEALWRKCHDHDIMVHAGYIVGFDHDTPDSVMRDVDELHRRGVDFASFFIKTLLRGSEDYARAIAAGVEVDPDFSKLDSFHVTTAHPRMTREQWENAYVDAWRRFYTKEHMIAALKRFKTAERRKLLLSYLFWARWSFAAERVHHMIAGFYRTRSYDDRKQDAPALSRLRYFREECARVTKYVPLLISELNCFRQVIFAVEYAPRLADTRKAAEDRLQSIASRVVRALVAQTR